MLQIQDCPVGSVESVSGEWGVLHVRTGSEAAVAERVAPFAPVFNPTVKVRRVYRKAKVEVDASVFPSYLFSAWGDPYQRAEVRRARDVIAILDVRDQDKLIRQLSSIEKSLSVDPYLDARDWQREGRRVRVTGGPFLGIEGFIVKRRNRNVLVVAVEILHRCVEMDIDPAMVEPI